jgi:hypothetical protein
VAADRGSPDADLRLSPVSLARDDSNIAVRSLGGDDLLSARGGAGTGDPLEVFRLALNGGDGDDVLLGHRGRDAIIAAAGDDLTRTGRGIDNVRLESGRDVAFLGPGPDQLDNFVYTDGAPDDRGSDRVFGGGGADMLSTQYNERSDRVNCGRGRDRLQAEPFDRHVGCEGLEISD